MIVLATAVVACRGQAPARAPAPHDERDIPAPTRPLVVVASDNDELDCDESCYGGDSLWLGARHAAFHRVLRPFSIRSPELSTDGGWIAYTDFATAEPDSDTVQIWARSVSWTPKALLGTPRHVSTAGAAIGSHVATGL